MSILHCDVCKSILEEPVTLPCGNSICFQHAGQFIQVKCLFCQNTHHEPCQKNIKLSNLIESLNRAQTACLRFKSNSSAHVEIIISLIESINTGFDKLKAEVSAEKDRIINQIEASSNECMSQIEDWRVRCMTSLRVKPEICRDVEDINSRIDQFQKVIQSGKISEEIWSDMEHSCDKMNQEVKKEIAKIKENNLLNTKVNFQPFNQPIEIGKIVLNKSNKTQNSCQSNPIPKSLVASSGALKLALTPSTTQPSQPTQAISSLSDKHNTRLFLRVSTGRKISTVCFDRTGRYIFTGSYESLIEIWRVCDAILVETLRGHEKEVTNLNVNFENTLLASSGNDNKILLWNLKNGEIVYNLNHHLKSISQVEFSPKFNANFSWFFSADIGGKLIFHKYTQQSSKDNKLFRVIFNEESGITSSSFSKGGSLLVVGKINGTIAIFLMDEDKPERIREIKAHNDEITSLSFSNLSLSFLTGSRDGFMKLWFVQDKTWVSTLFELEPSVTCDQTKVVFKEALWTCDDKLVVTSIYLVKSQEYHNKIKVWTPEGTLKHELNLKQDIVLHVKPHMKSYLKLHPFNPNILLALFGNVVLWDLNTGKKIFEDFDKGKLQLHSCWSPSHGERFVSIDCTGHLSIYGFGEMHVENRSQKTRTNDQKYLIEPLTNDLIESSEKNRLGCIMNEKEVIRKEILNFLQVKVECFKESSNRTKRDTNSDLDQSNKRQKN